MTRNTEQYAKQLLDRLIELDQLTAGAYYEMGRILSAVKDAELWKTLGYNSLTHMIEEELTFTHTTAGKYIFVYRRFRELNYKEAEALDVLTQFGISRTYDWIRTAKMKVGKRAIRKAIEKIKANKHQVNFTLNEKQYEDFSTVLERFGATRNESTGYWEGSTSAFVELIKAAKGNGKPALRLVK